MPLGREDRGILCFDKVPLLPMALVPKKLQLGVKFFTAPDNMGCPASLESLYSIILPDFTLSCS